MSEPTSTGRAAAAAVTVGAGGDLRGAKCDAPNKLAPASRASSALRRGVQTLRDWGSQYERRIGTEMRSVTLGRPHERAEI